MNKLTWGLTLVAAILWLIMPSPNAAAQTLTQQCRSGTACNTMPDGTRTCSQTTHCWWLMINGGFTYTDPEGGAPGINVPFLPLDQEPDSTMDCWKGVTDDARQTSGYPYRNDGVTKHNGIDVASGSGNYGHGAPIRSLGTGIVTETGANVANGNFIRIVQGDGIEMTYIHLLDFQTADGSLSEEGDHVMVNEQIARMNCTGYCGGAEEPERGHISKTHVHIQAKRLNGAGDDDDELMDPRYGGETCSLESGSGDDGSGGDGGGSGPGGGGGGTCTGYMCTTEP